MVGDLLLGGVSLVAFLHPLLEKSEVEKTLCYHDKQKHGQ